MDRDFLTDLSTKIVLGVKNTIFRIDMVIFGHIMVCLLRISAPCPVFDVSHIRVIG